MPAPAERNLIDPVGIDLMARVKVRHGAQLFGDQAFDNLSGKPLSFIRTNALRIRSNVDGLGKV